MLGRQAGEQLARAGRPDLLVGDTDEGDGGEAVPPEVPQRVEREDSGEQATLVVADARSGRASVALGVRARGGRAPGEHRVEVAHQQHPEAATVAPAADDCRHAPGRSGGHREGAGHDHAEPGQERLDPVADGLDAGVVTGSGVDRDQDGQLLDVRGVSLLHPAARSSRASGITGPWRGTRGCAPGAGRRAPRPAFPPPTTTPSSMKTAVSATSRAKPISWVTTTMVMPVAGEAAHHVQHVADQLGVEGGGGLVEEHQLGLHRQRPGDGDALLLAAGELGGVVCSAGPPSPTRSSSCRARALAAACRLPTTCTGASMMFSSAVMCGNRLKRWKTMPMSRRCAATSRSRSSWSRAAALPVADQVGRRPRAARRRSSRGG